MQRSPIEFGRSIIFDEKEGKKDYWGSNRIFMCWGKYSTSNIRKGLERTFYVLIVVSDGIQGFLRKEPSSGQNGTHSVSVFSF